MEQMHTLLKRQLRRHFGHEFRVPEKWEGFIAAVNEAYREFDTDRGMLERSLDLSSQELLQANSELRSLFQAVPDLVFRLNTEGRILACVAGNATHLSSTPEKLVGKRIQDVPLRSIGKRFEGAICRVRDTKTMVNIEYSMVLQTQEHWYEARLLALMEDQIMVIVRDISEQRWSQEALRNSEERFRHVADTAGEWIWEVDANGLYLYCSSALEKILGY